MTERERFKHIIDILGLKQTELADTIEMSQRDVSLYINGKSKYIKPVSLQKLNIIYGVNLNWLFTGEGSMLNGDRLEKMSGTFSLKDVVGKNKEEVNYKEEVFRLREECNKKANRIIELMEEVERLKKENTNLKIR